MDGDIKEESSNEANEHTESDDTAKERKFHIPEEFSCSLYISPVTDRSQVQGSQSSSELSPTSLEKVIRSIEPLGSWRVSATFCALIATFENEYDADKLLQRSDLAQILGEPIQVVRFSAKDNRYRQTVILKEVPWVIRIEDIRSALAAQGITSGNIERIRQCIRVEIFDANQYEILLHRGLNFFGAVRFNAVPERCWRGTFPGQTMIQGGGPSCNYAEPPLQHNDGILQCYRCQGFWHVAVNCRHLPRCVRCGEPHSVEFCPRPRNSPICCHCSGPHHAGYKQCPVRLQLVNATPVSLTLSTSRNPSKALKP